jgi:hypothetical protein
MAADTVPAALFERFLIHRGRTLPQNGSATLEACEIYNGSQLHLLRGMTIYVKTLTGEL